MRKIVVYMNGKILEGFSVGDDVKNEDITDESFQEVLSHLDWHWEEVNEWPEELRGEK
nr:MAG TPA: Repressor of phase-1 flagellin [Caudoviricetes sp.]